MVKKTNYTAIFALILFFCGVIFVSMFNTSFAFGANNTIKYFNVTVTVDGNQPPNITFFAVASATPIESNTVTAYVLFNVTDSNGYTNVSVANTYVNISLNGDLVQSSGCVDYPSWSGGSIRGVNCTVTFDYYQEPGNWNISAYTDDEVASDSEVNYSSFTYNTLYAFRLEESNVLFSGTSDSQDIEALNHQTINHTGNGYFANINITAQRLDGPLGNTIGPGNFTVNATTNAKGMMLDTTKTIAGLTLDRTENKTLYLWMDIPLVTANGQYNSSQEWVIEAYN